jgi:hypothetical protein
MKKTILTLILFCSTISTLVAQDTLSVLFIGTKPLHNYTTMDRITTTEKEGRRHNTGLAKVAGQCSADTFVVNQSLVLRINICAENRHHRQARNR